MTETLQKTESAMAFGDAMERAKLLSESTLVPKEYQRNKANCMIALEMANRIGANPLQIMQNLYIVHGKPAWSSQFLIACINGCGRFSALRYDMAGDGDNKGCIAWAIDGNGERLEGPRVDIKMAKAEGWYSKNGSKWQTMPDLMLRYRAATLFARLYAPELTMGMHTADEIRDITADSRVVSTSGPASALRQALSADPLTLALDGCKSPAWAVDEYLQSKGASRDSVPEKLAERICANPAGFDQAVSQYMDAKESGELAGMTNEAQ